MLVVAASIFIRHFRDELQPVISSYV